MGKNKDPKGSDWGTCPKCWKKIKKENLPKHLKKVHGILKPEPEPATRRKGKPFPIWKLTISAAITVVVVLIVMIAADRYLIGPEGPSINVEPSTYDFGIITPHTVWTNFTITNEGDTTLEIFNISTSCDCTQAVVTHKGQQSPTFKKENNPEYKVRISPGGTAKLTVSFDPDMYLNSGPIYRDVRMSTNDDNHKTLIITVTANVSR